MKLCQVCNRCAEVAEATCPQCGEASWCELAGEAVAADHKYEAAMAAYNADRYREGVVIGPGKLMAVGPAPEPGKPHWAYDVAEALVVEAPVPAADKPKHRKPGK